MNNLMCPRISTADHRRNCMENQCAFWLDGKCANTMQARNLKDISEDLYEISVSLGELKAKIGAS